MIIAIDIFQDEVEQPQSNAKAVEEIKADDNIEITNHDNEDSLNLTIGEEEEQLLRDEENDVKPKGESMLTIILGGLVIIKKIIFIC